MRGDHLTAEEEFLGDKYRWCPKGFMALKFTDRLAQVVLLRYADITLDQDLAYDIRRAVKVARSKPESCGE